MNFRDMVSKMVEEEEQEISTKPPKDCPWYKKKFCRIDGKPCPYSDLSYPDCDKFKQADAQDPDQVRTVLD